MFSVKLLAQSNSPVFPAVCTHNVDCPSVVGQKEAGAPSPSSFALPPESQFRDLQTVAPYTPDQALFGNTRIGCVAAEKVAK